MNDDDFRGSDIHHHHGHHDDSIHDQSMMGGGGGHQHSNNNEGDSEKGEITPVNIRQLINANMPSINNFEIEYKASKKKKIVQVTLVAQIVKFTDEAEKQKLTLFMDDGTGRMSVILFGIKSAQRFEPTGGVIENGLFLRIYGRLNTDTKTGTRYIIGSSLTVITDINEFTTHMLDIIVASLHSQYGSLIGRNVPKGGAGAVESFATDQQQQQYYTDDSHLGGAVGGGAGGMDHQQNKGLEVLIYEAVARKPGISFQEIESLLGADVNDIISAFEVLFMNGNLGYVQNSTERYILGPNKLF